MIFFKRKKKPGQTEGEFEASVRLGNAANAERRWVEASAHYENALRLRPADIAIRIQFGHSLKEQGLLAQAERAYGQATLDDPLDADAYLHLGHALKMQGAKGKAISAYRHAARLGSFGAIGKDARRELSALGINVPAGPMVDVSGVEIGERAQADLAAALRNGRLTKALTIIEASEAASLPLKFVKAQVYQVIQRYDDALVLYTELVAEGFGGSASRALRSLHIETGAHDKALQSLRNDLETNISEGAPFELQASLVSELVSVSQFALAFEAGAALFAANVRPELASARTAIDVKRDRVSRSLPHQLAGKFERDFLARSAALEKAGDAPQARLLEDEARALAAD
ncbi:tetratricopeptide repeat protein [Neorhizobium alkalisoli]|uniref:Uncharacterized protein n=1 Tax=Neorhizobium alkalisoli TaxID=528178 RepID=A0A561R3H2_9HYPH|nr:hypothetical protein [Neorhizobium alkalisoli]TWF57162.1 hypothetical protein FHW37_102803 [Neorhizobium alkalisoli]